MQFSIAKNNDPFVQATTTLESNEGFLDPNSLQSTIQKDATFTPHKLTTQSPVQVHESVRAKIKATGSQT
jgi:hypothetical protein